MKKCAKRKSLPCQREVDAAGGRRDSWGSCGRRRRMGTSSRGGIHPSRDAFHCCQRAGALRGGSRRRTLPGRHICRPYDHSRNACRGRIYASRPVPGSHKLPGRDKSLPYAQQKKRTPHLRAASAQTKIIFSFSPQPRPRPCSPLRRPARGRAPDKTPDTTSAQNTAIQRAGCRRRSA